MVSFCRKGSGNAREFTYFCGKSLPGIFALIKDSRERLAKVQLKSGYYELAGHVSLAGVLSRNS
jgi:hypothetical protein